MIQSNLVWIPSLQDFKRFAEITTRDLRILARTLDNELEFIYTMNELLAEKSLTNININELTLIDKYVICITLRIFSMGDTIPLKAQCSTCGLSVDHMMNVNDFMTSGLDVLDKKYFMEITDGSFVVGVGMPTIGTEFDIVKNLEINKIKRNSVDSELIHKTLSYIQTLKIKDTVINLADIEFDNLLEIYKKLPGTILNKIQDEFIKPIADTITPKLFEIECKTKGCKPIVADLRLENINDIVRLIFRASPGDILEEIFLLGKLGSMDPFYIDSLTPAEKDVIIMLQNKSNHEEDSQNNSDINKAWIE